MTQREEECWQRFCQTGLVSDYLEYRSAADFVRRVPQEDAAPGEDQRDAGWNQGGGAQSQKPGGV